MTNAPLQRTQTRPRMELAFESIGSGAPLIVLHDLFGSAAGWRGVARELADAHRVCCVDLRNHGRSPRATQMTYVEMADDVLRLIEHEGFDRPALVGHGMGGRVAMALALTAPHAVGALAVVDVAPFGDDRRWPQQLQIMSDMLARGAPQGSDGTDGAANVAGDSTLIEAMMPRLATRNAYVDWRSNLGAIGRSIQELCAFPRHLRYLSSDAALHAIVGARSDNVRPATAGAFAPMFPRATIEVIADAGHWVHADQPDALVRKLRSVFVKEAGFAN